MQSVAKLGISIAISPVGSDLPTAGTLASVSSIDRSKEWQPTFTPDEDGLLHQLRASLAQALDSSTCKLLHHFYHILYLCNLERFGNTSLLKLLSDSSHHLQQSFLYPICNNPHSNNLWYLLYRSVWMPLQNTRGFMHWWKENWSRVCFHKAVFEQNIWYRGYEVFTTPLGIYLLPILDPIII